MICTNIYLEKQIICQAQVRIIIHPRIMKCLLCVESRDENIYAKPISSSR
uniref:Uncharacterized protein n=1 Tax=Rhizophora mucronata TaxID=61149 RepID=A0A2P2PZZ0_RHIMU